jgi:hypothetical protein
LGTNEQTIEYQIFQADITKLGSSKNLAMRVISYEGTDEKKQ